MTPLTHEPPARAFEDAVNAYFDRAASFTEHPKGLLNQIRGESM